MPNLTPKTIFISGSRKITRLDAGGVAHLHEVLGKCPRVLIGDAPGADLAVQRLLDDLGFPHAAIEIFCSGRRCRNNLGRWRERHIDAGAGRGRSFHEIKDEAMARESEGAFMVWDGESSGTLMNVYRMSAQGKASLVYLQPQQRFVTVDSTVGWEEFLLSRPTAVRRRFQGRIALPAVSCQLGLF